MERSRSRIHLGEGAIFTLRPFTPDDAEGLYAYASHPEVGPPAGWPPHRSVEESRQVIENIFIPSDALAVLRKSDGRLIGSAGFVDRHRTELGTPWIPAPMPQWSPPSSSSMPAAAL